VDAAGGKLLELLLIVGALAWFGYAQLRAVRRRPPPDDPADRRSPDSEDGDR
jgi:hypothetical protein